MSARDALTSRSDAVNAAVRFIKKQLPASDAFDAGSDLTAIVLGSGLGSLADKIESQMAIAFGDVPGFARSTAGGHRGQLIIGNLESKPVIAMAGRLHRYEGWTTEQVTFPIEVMIGLGAKRLIASNAAGGVNPKLRVGDILVIRDHIDWLHERGTTDETEAIANETAVNANETEVNAPTADHFGTSRLGILYDPDLAQVALTAARKHAFTAIEGTYLATLGPTYETRAEYRMMRRIGADVVGMSTVPEVLAAARAEISVLALSIVSNVADPDRAIVADHAEVLQAGDAAAAKLEGIVRQVLSQPAQ